MRLLFDDRQELLQIQPIKNHCFMALPGLRIDFNADLIEELSEQGITCTTLFNEINQEEFLCSVNQNLVQAEMVLADLTDYNLNVVFELGLANGLGIPSVMIKDDTIEDKIGIPELLSTVRQEWYVDYSALTDSCLSHLEKIHKAERGKPHMPFGVRTWKEPIVFDCCFFSMEVPGEWTKSVNREIKRALKNLNYESFDNRTGAASKISNALCMVTKSATNVFRFLNSREKNSEVVNLNTALLAGFSYGLGRTTICLIPDDLKSLLADIRNHGILYSTPKTLRSGLAEELADLAESFAVTKKKRIDKVHAEIASVKEFDIRELRFGNSSASADDLLLRSFEEWPLMNDLLSKRRSVVIGRKGTGKTAIKRILEEIRIDSDRNVVLSIDPIDEEVGDLYSYRKILFNTDDISKVGALAKLAWMYLLPLYTLDNATSEFIERLPHELVTELEAILQAIPEFIHAEPIAFNVATRLQEALDGNEEVIKNEKLVASFKRANRLISNLTKKGCKCYILIDSLDIRWHTNSIIPLAFIFGLIEAIRYLNDHTQMYVVLMLREDIYRNVRRFLPEIDKIQPVSLEWTKTSIRNCIIKRITAQISLDVNASDDDYINTLFANEDGKSALDELMENIEMRPRQVIQLCTYCWDQVLLENRKIIEFTDVDTQAKKFSQDRHSLIVDEYGKDLPWLDSFIYHIVGGQTEFIPSQIIKFIGEKLNSNNILSDTGDLLSDELSRVDQVVKELVSIGVFNVIWEGEPLTGLNALGEFNENFAPSNFPEKKQGWRIFKRVKEKDLTQRISYVLSKFYKLGIV